VAVGTKGNEIAIRIIAQLAPALDVMDFESGRGAAELAKPTISLKNLLAQLAVCLRVQPNPAERRYERLILPQLPGARIAPLRGRQEAEQPRHGKEQDLRIPVFQLGDRQHVKICNRASGGCAAFSDLPK